MITFNQFLNGEIDDKSIEAPIDDESDNSEVEESEE